jgi:hypothetical protein
MDDDYQHEELNDSLVKSEVDEDSLYRESTPKPKKAKTRPTNTASAKPRVFKTVPPRQGKSGKSFSTAVARKAKSTTTVVSQQAAPPSQTVSPTPARKTSTVSVNVQTQLAADEEDLSTKPRCQRCRKSKKGCDRQRPCGRCKDAGIGLDGCISEDEGNGRKGRYGRHMGVPVKKAPDAIPASNEPQLIGTTAISSSSAIADKNKKRKR